MPVYEYICESCQHRFELLRPVNKADEDVPCPNCQGKSKRRMSSVSPTHQWSLGPAEGEQFRKWKMA